MLPKPKSKKTVGYLVSTAACVARPLNKIKNKKAPKQGGKAVSKTQADVSAGWLALFVFMLSTSMHARSVLHLTRACANKVSFEGALAWSTF